MATILLTSACNPYCLHGGAGNQTSSPCRDRLLSWENLIYIADFLRTSGQGQVSLGGGEPTRHPECVDFILYLLDRGFDVTLFTDGSLSPSRLEEFRGHLTGTPGERLQVVCRLRDPVQSPGPPDDAPRLHRFLAVMGPWTQAGFIIQQVDFTLDFLFDHINRFGMKRQLRLGLAQPVPGSQAGFIPAEDMRRVVERLYVHRRLFDTHRVRLHLECGFPLCQFSDAELGWLHRAGGHFPCGCEPAFDIWPDMNVSHCLPLSRYGKKSLFEFDALEQVHRHFAHLRDEITAETAGVYAECHGCGSQEEGRCRGGGMCRIVERGIGAAPRRVAGGEDGISPDRLPG